MTQKNALLRVVTGHGIHEFPLGELALEHVAIGEYDIELRRVSEVCKGRDHL